jgi:hypothetical protein
MDHARFPLQSKFLGSLVRVFRKGKKTEISKILLDTSKKIPYDICNAHAFKTFKFRKLHACFSLDMSKELFWIHNFATLDINKFPARLQGFGTKSKERRELSLIKH